MTPAAAAAKKCNRQIERDSKRERKTQREREAIGKAERKVYMMRVCVCVWVNRMCVCVSGVKKQYEMKFGEDVRARRMYIYTRS